MAQTTVSSRRDRNAESSVAVKITVMGAGYVGLTSAACLSHLGYVVDAVDIDPERVDLLNHGRSPILEEGLAALIQAGLEARRLSFTTDAGSAASGSDFVFLCVPTPQGADGAADLSFVKQASAQIAPYLKTGAVVINKSTVPVGTAAAVMAALGRPDTAVVSNPEFLREGHAVHDWLNPDRIVIGSDDPIAAQKVAELYEPLNRPFVVTDPASSETIKYACNAFLAAKVSFVNAIAQLCGAVGADAVDVIRGMSYDRRIGADHLAPGPGWGGSCFPKDINALISIAEAHGYDFALLKEVVAANEAQFDSVTDRVQKAAGGSLQGATIGAWGLTFKAGTDDLRDSPALAILQRLRQRGADLKAFDPSMPDPCDGHLTGLELDLCGDPYSACKQTTAVVILTEWPEFREIDLQKVASVMASPNIIDARNVLEPDEVRAHGLTYCGIGRRE
jgi:UDPglucose 6-dehydrogenase